MTTIIHDSTTCELGLEGEKCEMCKWSDEQECQRLNQTASTLVPLPDFDSDWLLAPRSMRNYVERSVAEYWYLRGAASERVSLMATQNEDMRALLRSRPIAAREGTGE